MKRLALQAGALDLLELTLTGLNALRVLVADDNREMRTIVGSVLTAAGVGLVRYAVDGATALDMIRSGQFDAVYLDYEMPKLDGLETLRSIRTDAAVQRFTPVIMLTGHSDAARIAAARDAGVNEFLCKPVTARTILTRLESIIANHRTYVQAGDFFGPDRRRRSSKEYRGPERRSTHLV